MSARTFHFVVLLGSLRRASHTRAIANTLDELAPDDVAVRLLGCISELPPFNPDWQDFGLPSEVYAMGSAIDAADAVVIVTPEYNHSVPGMLNNALDWLSRLEAKPFERKPVAIQTASPGILGGVRAQAPLREVLSSMNALVLNHPEVVVPQVSSKVDTESALLRDPLTRHLITAQLQALTRLSRWRP